MTTENETKHVFCGSAERSEMGKALRAQAPRAAHGDWKPASDRRDPLDVLEESNRGRVPELIPIRHGRMLASPFALLRGSAAVMAADLATTPASGIRALARAHAKGGDAALISDYLGKSDAFDQALAKFALAYADQTERDHAALAKAVKSGRVQAIIDR